MLFGCFLGCNDTIAPCVELCILNLQLWVGKKIFDTATNALIEANIGRNFSFTSSSVEQPQLVITL